MSEDAFALMMESAAKLKTMDPKINKSKRKTIARIQKDAQVLKDIKTKQREKNLNEMKIDRELQKEGVNIFDEHSDQIIRPDIAPPPFIFPEDENDNYHVMILTSNVVEKGSLYQIPERFQENIQKLPDSEYIEPEEEGDEKKEDKKENNNDDDDDDENNGGPRKRYKKHNNIISPVDPVLQLSCLTKEGCPVLVNCHGFHPSFLIPVPTSHSRAIIHNLFPKNPSLVLPFDRDLAYKERKERDALLAEDPLVQHCCERTRIIFETALKTKSTNPGAGSLKWITGDWKYPLIIRVQMVASQNLYGYDANKQHFYYKITVRTERVKWSMKHILMNSKNQHHPDLSLYWMKKEYDFFNFTLTTEAEIFRDCDFSAGAWLTLNKDTYELTTHLLPEAQYEFYKRQSPEQHSNNREIFMQAEFDIHYQDITSHHPLVPNSAERLEKLNLPPLAPIRVFSFDIECAGRKDHFVNSALDPICNICGITANTSDMKDPSKWKRVLFTWETDLTQFALHHPEYNLKNMTQSDLNEGIVLLQNKDTTVYMCKDERQMLACFADYWRMGGFGVVTGYNINFFDIPYAKERASLLGLKTFTLLSPYHKSMKIIETTFQSRATSVRVLKDVEIPGMVVFDMLRWCSRELKLPSITLNDVSAHILKDKKHDLHHSNITPMFYGTKEMKASLFEYCLKDCLLPLKLMFHPKVGALHTYLEIAKTTGTTLEILLTRGQGIKSESLLQRYMKSYHHGYICPLIHRPQIEEDIKNMDAYLDAVKKMENQFEGATVIEPKKKLYKRPIGVGDFNSLYPSILISHNLCYTTIILDHSLLKDLKAGEDYIAIEVKKKDGTFSHYLYFVTQTKRPAFVSFILRVLWDGRQGLKKMIKACIVKKLDTTLLEARSNAMKLTSNSCYGMFAGFTLPYLSEISQTVCIIGKQSLEKVKRRVESWFSPSNKERDFKEQAVVVYGDSVTGNTPILVRDHEKRIHITRIASFANSYQNNQNWIDYSVFKIHDGDPSRRNKKQYIPPSYWEVWTSNGWSKIKRVIQHIVAKKIIRVVTELGVVDVTEDHSLLLKDLTPVKPLATTIGTELYHYFPNHCILPSSLVLSTEEAWLWGFFLAVGSINVSVSIISLVIHPIKNPIYFSFFQQCHTLFQKVYPDLIFSLESEGEGDYEYHLCVTSNNSQNLASFVQKYHSLFYDPATRAKIVPSDILNGSKEIQFSFLEGYSNGTSNNRLNDEFFRVEDQVTAQGLYYVANSLYSSSVVLEYQDGMYVISLFSKIPKKSVSGKIVEMISFRTHDDEEEDVLVYDLETETGNFQAGVGEIIVKNTDSVMIDFGVDTLLECNIRMNEAVRICNAMDFAHLPPMKLDGEKIYFPWALYDKKRYGGFKHELLSDEEIAEDKPFLPSSLDIKGIETKRRDKIKLSRECVSGILMRILDLIPVVILVEWVREQNIKLVRGEFDLSYIIQTLPVKANYSTKCPGSVIKDILTKRDPANPPSVGSRMNYVIVVRPKAHTLPLWARVAPPEDVLNGKETPDYISIGIQKMKKAQLRMLGIPGLLEPAHQERMFQYILQPFSRRISNPDRPIVGKIDSYFLPKDKCRVCNIEIDRKRDGNRVVCITHRDTYPQILLEYEGKVVKHQTRHDIIWDGCRKCVGEIGLDPKTCNNLSCSFYYERAEVKQELQQCTNTLQKIQIRDW
jgi:DNA polymerase elongation subunit (family B)